MSPDTYEEVKACASEEQVASTVERARANSVRRQAQAFSRPTSTTIDRATGAAPQQGGAARTLAPPVEADEEALADVFASLTSLHRRDEKRKSRMLGGIPEGKPASAESLKDTLEVPETAAAMNRKLNASVRRGELSEKRALQAARWVDKEVGPKRVSLLRNALTASGVTRSAR